MVPVSIIYFKISLVRLIDSPINLLISVDFADSFSLKKSKIKLILSAVFIGGFLSAVSL